MWKKIIVAGLVITVLAAMVMAFVETQGQAAAVAAGTAPAATAPSHAADSADLSQPPAEKSAGDAAIQQELNRSVDTVGEAWSAAGTIVELGEVGMTVALDDDNEVYVELGPSFYWRAQGALAAGDVVTIDGFYNGDQYHAASITKADGARLALRSATGQPLWSGGAANGGGATHGGQGASGAGAAQVAPEDWKTIAASVLTVNRNGLTVQAADGATQVLSFGRADFWQGQAVHFVVGDAIEIKGFWQDGQFQTGQVTKTATGERLLLRDPNGRPLWAGPGRQGGQGQGQGGRGAGAIP